MAKTFTVIGVERKELFPIWDNFQVEHDGKYNIRFDMGRVFIWSDDKGEETKESIATFIKAVNEGLHLNIPTDAKLICLDGDQDFDFYIGFMFEQ